MRCLHRTRRVVFDSAQAAAPSASALHAGQQKRPTAMCDAPQVWVCPEQHGSITGVFKNQIDWIPLSLGSVRPTQGRTLAVAQVGHA